MVLKKKSIELVTQTLHKERCIKEQIYFKYFMLAAFSSPVKFSQIAFPVWNLKLCDKNQFLSVVKNHSKSDFSSVNWVAESEEIREVYSVEIFLNTATIREVNSTVIDSFFA